MNRKNSCNLYHKPMEKDRPRCQGRSGEAAQDIADEEEGARDHHQTP
jgi:hypothetical protein